MDENNRLSLSLFRGSERREVTYEVSIDLNKLWDAPIGTTFEARLIKRKREVTEE